MILPTKEIPPDRSLMAVGAQIAQVLQEPLTVSQTWVRLREWRDRHAHAAPVSFGWFVLALDMLYALGVVELRENLLTVRRVDAAAAWR
jgi:hypothetical protein